MPKLFTLAQANDLIPALQDLITRAHDAKVLVDRYHAQIEELGRQARGNGHTHYEEIQQLGREAEKAADEPNRVIEQIGSIGCEVKDLDRGLVDFPHEREGTIVYLCWQLGETTIGYWHGLDTGFAGRQPL